MRTRWQKMLPQRHLFQRLAVGGQDFILKLAVEFRGAGEADVPKALAGAVAGHGHEEAAGTLHDSDAADSEAVVEGDGGLARAVPWSGWRGSSHQSSYRWSDSS